MASSRSHARTFLEAILAPPQSSGAIGSRPTSMQRTPSRKEIGAASAVTAASEQYKPARSSTLAAPQPTESDKELAKAHDELDNDDEHQRDERRPSRDELHNGEVSGEALQSAGWPSTPSKPASVLSSEDDEYDPSQVLRIFTPGQASRRPSEGSNTAQQAIRHVLTLLDDEDFDDEERIENVRYALAKRLRDIEGTEVAPPRLDSIVLQLLHRHREDVKPTGATFALPASPSPSPFPPSPRARPRPANLRSGSAAAAAWPRTPTRPSTPSSSQYGPIGEASSPLPSSPMPAALNSSGFSNASPRASPSLFHRALSGQVANSAAGANSTRSASSIAGLSRPSSPTLGLSGSPSLNVGALEFKPRSSTASTHSTATTPREPWLADGMHEFKAPSASSKSALDDSDEDEFSPFATSSLATIPAPSGPSAISLARPPPGRGRPISGTSGNSSIQSLANTAESVAGSYHGSTTSTSLESADELGNMQLSGLEQDFEGLTMSPFDVLTSILSGIGNTNANGPAPWSPEQIEEALDRCGWDIDAAISTLLDQGPMQSGPAPPTGPRSPMPAQRLAGGTPPASSRSGVSVVPRDVFASQRAGMSRIPSSQDLPGRPGFARAPSTGAPASPHLSHPTAPGRQVPGRVCRFFLAGECRRADCRFSHDVSRAICRFWLKGQCLNGEECSFVHDASLLDTVANRVSSIGSHSPAMTPLEPETPPNDDFPELNLAPTGPKAQRNRQGPMSLNDPARTRWAQTLQHKWSTPMSQVQQGESHVTLHGKAGAVRGAPTGPRAGFSGSPATAGSSALRGVVSARIPLRPPLLLPTLSTGRTASQSYASYREACSALSDKRNKCLARAAEAWKAGNGADARKWSREGQSLNQVLHEESRSIARSILRERHDELRSRLSSEGGSGGSGTGGSGLVDASTDERGARGLRGKAMGGGLGLCLGVVPARTRVPGMAGDAGLAAQSLDERTDVLLDCHLLHASEAVEFLEEFLIGLEREQFRGLAHIAVGVGKHTSTETDKRRVGLAAGLRHFLSSWGYPYAEHDGVIVVDPLSHL